MEENRTNKQKHNIILENRRKLCAAGVTDVTAFDEEKIVLTTALGDLTVGGYGLHIGSFSQETGELEMDGEICSLVYSETKQEGGGFFSRLFR